MEALFNRIGKAGIALVGSGIVMTKFIFVIDGGERGVLFDNFRGVLPGVYGEGMHFKVPVIQKPRIFEIRTRP